jgi:hypothetical protein
LYVDGDITNFSDVELPVKIVVTTVFDDTPHHFNYPHHPLVDDLLRDGIPLLLPLLLALLRGRACREIVSHMTPDPWPGVLRGIDVR